MLQQITTLTKSSLPLENAIIIIEQTSMSNCSIHSMLSRRGGVPLFTENVIELFPPHAHTNNTTQ